MYVFITSIPKLITLDLKPEKNSLETINILPIYIQLGFSRLKALDVKRTDFFHVLNPVNWVLVIWLFFDGMKSFRLSTEVF